MMPYKNISLEEKGFTLFEVILTLAVAAILATVVYTYIDTNVRHSVNPLNIVKTQDALNDVMERIVNDYKTNIKNSTLNLSTFSTAVTAAYSAEVDNLAASFVSYNNTTGAESTCSYGTGCKNLKISLTKNNQFVTALFTE
jgi:prepilin-type N-terminal cleavage/methylation domain-containing protein